MVVAALKVSAAPLEVSAELAEGFGNEGFSRFAEGSSNEGFSNEGFSKSAEDFSKSAEGFSKPGGEQSGQAGTIDFPLVL